MVVKAYGVLSQWHPSRDLGVRDRYKWPTVMCLVHYMPGACDVLVTFDDACPTSSDLEVTHPSNTCSHGLWECP